MGTYNVIMTCRNSEKYVRAAILSITNQTIKPEYVIVIDDGSTDNTPAILKEINSGNRNVSVISNPDLGYDIGRVVFNWNKAIKLAKELNLPQTDYHMISSDDAEYELQYAEKIVKYMDYDPLIAIASGEYNNDNSSKPRGSGRFVRNSFLFSVHGYYPERIGYESAILYIALKNRLKYLVIHEAHYVHARPLGSNHHFHDWGQSMRSLGYHPFFAFSRFVKYFLLGKPIGRLGALRMFYYYLSYKPKDEGYDSMYDSELRKFVRLIQLNRIKGYIGLGHSE
jgi:glycosyltransferase involved in cell wall biosynthesis